MSLTNECTKIYLKNISEKHEVPCDCPMDNEWGNSNLRCDCPRCNECDNSREDVESLHTCDSVQEEQSKPTNNKNTIKRTVKTIAMSWKFWLLLFILAIVMGVMFYINKTTECEKNTESETTESQTPNQTTTSQTIMNTTVTTLNPTTGIWTTTTTTIRTTTRDVWNPAKN